MKALIVDDNEDVRVLQKTILESQGYTVESAEDGKQALEMAKRSLPVPDIIISDILMPRMDGFELCHAMKADEKLKNIPFLFYSATYTSYDDKKLAMASGASRFITKPIAIADFLRIIQEVLEEHKKGGIQVPDQPKMHDEELDRLHKTVIIKKLDKKMRQLEEEREELRDSEERFRSISASAQDAIVLIDQRGIVQYWNESAERIFGYSKDEAIGQSLHELVVPHSIHERFLSGFKKFQEKGEGDYLGKTVELVAVRKDGTEFPIEHSISAVTLKGKLHAVGLVRDISERKRAEERIRKLSRAVEQSPTTIVITNTDAKIEYVNPYFTDLTGYTSEEVIGQNPRILQSGRTAPEEYKEMWDTISAGKVWRGEFCNRKKSGELYWEDVSISSVESPEGITTHFVAVKVDITGRKQTEKELKDALDKLRKTLGGTIQALAATVETRDPYTAGHQKRVADLSRAIAKEMGLSLDRVEGIRMAGTIHDIGKICVPAEILSKPGKISESEFNIIRTHSQAGYDILKDIEFPWPIAEMVLQHQERMDGSGYPNGLKGDQIIIGARILAVADVVEAMSSHRPYRASLGIDNALEEISKNKGVFYDPDVVDACLKIFREKGYQIKKIEINEGQI